MANVVVVGSGQRAAQWATRYLVSGFDVTAAADVVGRVGEMWTVAELLGVAPQASPDRLTVFDDHSPRASHQIVHYVGDDRGAIVGDLVIDDSVVTEIAPVHLIGLIVAEPTIGAALHQLGLYPVSTADEAHLRTAVADLTAASCGNDTALVAMLRALRGTDHPLAAALAHHESMTMKAGDVQPWREGDDVAAPLWLYRTHVAAEWVDYNGHMTESAYLLAAGWASDALFRYIGIDDAYRSAGSSFFTVETHIHYLREVALHAPLTFATQILGIDHKRVHLLHTMYLGAVEDPDALSATLEQMLVHVDMRAGRSSPIPAAVAAALTSTANAHRGLPTPPQVGSRMAIPQPRN